MMEYRHCVCVRPGA